MLAGLTFHKMEWNVAPSQKKNLVGKGKMRTFADAKNGMAINPC